MAYNFRSKMRSGYNRMRSSGSGAARAAYTKLKSTKKMVWIVTAIVGVVVYYLIKKGKITINK